MVKRAPTLLEFLHAAPGTYPEFERTYSSRPPMPDRLAGRWSQGPHPQFLAPQIQDAPDAYAPPPILGPGGITNSAPFEGPRLPHVSLASVLAAPMATPEAPAAPAPMGLLPGMNPGGVKNDAGVAPLTAATTPINPADAANALNPLRLPRHVQPGQASQASVNAVRGYGSIGDASWWMRLLGA